MEYENFNYEERRGVAVISLKKRVENWEGVSLLSTELSECCQNFRESPETRALVVTGETKDAFSIENVRLNNGMKGGLFPSLAGPVAAVESPVLAGIPGDAIGLGLELALACDLRIATKGAHFALPHVKWGAMPWDGGTQRLPRLVGKGKAIEMILTGKIINAKEAHRIGLINEVLPEKVLITSVKEVAHKMASKGPIALRYAKEAINKGMDLSLEQGLRLEADLYFLLHTTKDRTEGIKAFREKRTPEFEGQ